MHREVGRISQKLLNTPWPKYPRSIQIGGLRGWDNQTISFRFPVSVIAGENGSGKSTVLKAAALAYEHPKNRSETFFAPAFFPDTAWDEVSGVRLIYEISQGKNRRTYSIRRPSERWRYDSRPKRHVLFQDISRTIPIEATVGYARIAKRLSHEVNTEKLDSTLSLYYSEILGRRYDDVRLATSDIDDTKDIGVLKISGYEYSQFHQGAGEDATLDLMMAIQEAPKSSLIIIDEIEASLHPRSQRRLIHFLLWLSRTREIQIILSTHSNYVLEELPPEARIFLQRSGNEINVFYGVTSNFALSKMDDVDKPDIHVFVEDEESQVLCCEILRSASVDITRIKILPVGPADVVIGLGRIASRGGFPIGGIGVVDADQTPKKGSIALPGSDAPERDVFSGVLKAGIDDLSKRLGLSEKSLRSELEATMSISDHHKWLEELQRRLNQTKGYLWVTLCQVWIDNVPKRKNLEKFASAISERLESTL